MPTINFYKAGQLGIIKDIPPEELPPHAWSDGNNVRFEDGKILRAPGMQNVFGTPLAAPYWLMPIFTPTQVFWAYASLTNLYLTDGSAHDTVTRAVGGTYGTTDRELWNGGMLSGIPVITNGVDVPQYFASPAIGNNFADLTAWPATARAKVIKPYKNFLVAMNLTKSSVKYGSLVKWSSPAVPGAIPSSWNEADPTTLAGEVEIPDEYPGEIQDGLVLRDVFIIYKDNSVWGMQFIGGQNVFRFYPIFTSSGILTTHCVKAIRKGTMHFVATGDDIVVHDGQNIDSILDQRWKRFLRNNLATSQFNRSFVVVNHNKDEAWFCFANQASVSGYPNMALIWNWRDNSLTARDLAANTVHMDSGPVQAGGDPWDADGATWDSDSSVWDVLQYRVHFSQLLGANQSASRMQQHDDNTISTFNGVNYTSFVERTGIALTGQDRVSGEFKADYNSRKICKRIWIKATGAAFQVQIGSQESTEATPVYEAAQTFTPGTTRYLDFFANGKFIAVKFFSDSGGEWAIEGYDLEIEVLGALG